MKEIYNNKNENIGFSTSQASLDYLIKEKPVSLSGDLFSEVLSGADAEMKLLNRSGRCFEVRFLRGFIDTSTLTLREERCLDSRRKRYILQLETVNDVKGMLLENDSVVKTIGIGGLNQKSVDKFSSEFLSNFSNCRF